MADLVGARVVVVEDDVSTRKLIAKHLRQMGCRVVECGDIESSEVAIAENSPQLVCLDLGLPVGSGFRIAEWVRKQEQFALMPILVITARTSVEDHARALEAGVDEIMAKPFKGQELIKRASKLIKHGRRKTQY